MSLDHTIRQVLLIWSVLTCLFHLGSGKVTAGDVPILENGAVAAAKAVVDLGLIDSGKNRIVAEVVSEELVLPEEWRGSDGVEVQGTGSSGVASYYEFDGLDDDVVDYNTSYLDDAFIRPGIANENSRLVPYRAAQRLAKGLRFHSEAGIGYDSNTLLSDGGYRSPTHPDRGNRGGMVSWFRFGVGYNGGTDSSGDRHLIYGFDIGGDIVSYDRGGTRSSRGNAQPYFAPYIGVVGAKTTVRLSTRYDLSEGNYIYSSESRREAPVAQSQSWGWGLSAVRQMSRGTLTYIFDYNQIEFEDATLLNDQESVINDISYLHQPASMPKTELGGGFRWGSYDTRFNPDQRFYEPSLRINLSPTQKTRLYGRIGYAFRDSDGFAAVGNDGMFTDALGASWAATERINVNLETYRDFRPSYVSAGESFNTNGVKMTVGYASPFWRLNFATNFAYELADYYSTSTASAGSNREDEYFRWGVTAGRPINLLNWVDTSISLFYDYSENSSNDFQGSFDRHFTGIRVSGSL